MEPRIFNLTGTRMAEGSCSCGPYIIRSISLDSHGAVTLRGETDGWGTPNLVVGIDASPGDRQDIIAGLVSGCVIRARVDIERNMVLVYTAQWGSVARIG